MFWKTLFTSAGGQHSRRMHCQNSEKYKGRKVNIKRKLESDENESDEREGDENETDEKEADENESDESSTEQNVPSNAGGSNSSTAVDDQRGDFVSFEIFAKIDSKLAKMVKPIEQLIRSHMIECIPHPPTSYHMNIYSIYNGEECGELISPIKRWYNATRRTIPKRCAKIPYEALKKQNNEAACVLERNLNKPLKIKYASLNFGTKHIYLMLDLEAESLERIRNARREFAEIYDHPDLSLEPVNEKLHIKLAYVKRRVLDVNVSNQLNYLVRVFVGTKFTLPSIYLDNGDRYIEFKGKNDCWSSVARN